MMQPIEDTAMAAQQAIEEEFGFFSDWSERYQYLIDLGRRLPEFPNGWKIESNRLLGCQSNVWIVPHQQDGKLYFSAISDSSIVSGLVYLALRIYSGRSKQEILNTEPDFIKAIGLSQHLSPTRNNGFASLLQFIRKSAAQL